MTLESALDLASLQPVGVLLLHTLANLLLLSSFPTLRLSSTTQARTIMSLIPLSEGGRIDLNDGGAGQGVGSNEFVVGWVEDDTDDTSLAGDGFRAPGEVSAVETEGAEFAVSSTGAD